MNLPNLLEEFNVVIDTPEGLTELRSLILGLAVRGKLVPQDPYDEPASELLKKIEPVRKEYFEEGPHREPPKRKKIKDNEIDFNIPSGWVNTRFSSIINIINGRAYKKDELLDEGVPVLRVGNLFTSNKWYYSDLELDEHKYIDEGDLIYAWSASFGPFIWDGSKVIYHYHIWKLEFYLPELISKKFLYYFLEERTAEIKASGHGISMAHMTKGKMEKLVVPLPPLAEQHRIVQKIESLFAEVDELEAKLNRQTKLDEKLQLAVNADVQKAPDAEASKSAWTFITSNFDTLYHTPEAIDNLKKNILNEAVRGRLVPQNPNDEPASELLNKIEAKKQRLYEEGEIRKPKKLPPVKEDEIPFEIPGSWEWARVETVGITQTGTTPKTSNSEFYGDYIPFVGPGDMSIEEIDYSNNGLSEKGLEAGRLIPKGSILMVCIGGSIGKCHIVNRDVSCNQQINTIFPIAGISNHYIKSVFRSDYFQKAILSKSTGSATPIINRTKWGSIPISLPPLKEQHRLVRRIEELFAICDRFKTQLEQREKVNERLVKGLVQEVLEGSSGER